MNGRQALRLAAIGFFHRVRGFVLVMIDKTQIHPMNIRLYTIIY